MRPRRSSSVPHAKRPTVAGAVHVVQRIRKGLPNQDHLHLVIDADDKQTLARGMQGLAIRIAKALNRRWNRRGRGSVFAERYFPKAMKTYGQVRRTLRYVLFTLAELAAASVG